MPRLKMDRPPCRKFTLADLMILIAATAVGLAGTRCIEAEMQSFTDAATIGLADRLTLGSVPLAAALALAMIVIRLRLPRPRRAFRQPGLAAGCVTASSVILISLLEISRMLIYQFFNDSEVSYYKYFTLLDLFYRLNGEIRLFCGFGILASWSALGLAGCWRPEASWIDRVGRLLGLYWIILWGCGMLGIYGHF